MLMALQWPPDIDILLKYITTDDRPTCIVRVISHAASVADSTTTPQCVFRNDAFDRLMTANKSESLFDSWLAKLPFQAISTQHQLLLNSSTSFVGRTWSWRSLGQSYFAVHCTSVTSGGLVNGSVHDAASCDSNFSKLNHGHDFLLRVPHLIGDSYATFFANYDWAKTPLGSIQNWHPVLREFTIALLACPNPRAIYWGPDFVHIYNEQVVPMYRTKHPWSLGQPLSKIWGQNVADEVSKSFSLASTIQLKSSVVDKRYLLERDGQQEESYFTYNSLPLCDADGVVLGHMLELSETTPIVLLQERLSVKQKVIECAESMRNPLELWTRLATAITPDEAKDFCYAMVFAADDDVRAVPDSPNATDGSQRYRIQQTWGVPQSQVSQRAPELLVSASKMFSRTGEEFVLLQQQSETLPKEFAISVGEHGVVNTACAFPINNYNGHGLAVIVLGINPCRRFNDDMLQYVQSIRDVFSRRVAELSRPHDEHTDAMSLLYRDASIGFYKFRPDGHPMFLNEKYFELLGLDRSAFEGPLGNFAWMSAVQEEDKDVLARAWEHLIATGEDLTKFRTKAHGPDRWIESQAFCERNEDGEIFSVYGWLTDISHRERNELLMAEKLTDALAAKNAATQFIDIVSHEIRNPLGSMLQLADGILATVKPTTTTLSPKETASIIDAAQTINLCAQHQKTIVDDILTLSKLDSKLVELSPDVVRIRHLLDQALKMVEVDLVRAKIDTELRVSPECDKLGIDHILFDVGRVLQILLNLLTNAIKFTQNQRGTRRITIGLNASVTRPDGKQANVQYIKTRTDDSKLSPQQSLEDWEGLWLEFSVTDTGLGMTEEESSHLFSRFAQASPRTYKQYGGSGLGLFICRELAELLGGQIGLTSKHGCGTSVCFYLKAKSVPAPRSESLSANDEHIKNKNAAKASIKDLSILLVEDNAINQKVMSQQLRRTGCSVLVADNGKIALEHLKKALASTDGAQAPSISLILMDVEMPIMDGLICTRRIREMEAAGDIKRHIPIAAITANSREQQINTAMEAGMDDVVTKPFRISDIIPRIEVLATEWNVPQLRD